MDGNTSFNRTWVDYKNGFGTYNHNFWLGLENMYRITASGVYRLRFEFKMTTAKWLSAECDTFYLDGGAAYYTLHVSGYSGNGGDWLNANDILRKYTTECLSAPGSNCTVFTAPQPS